MRSLLKDPYCCATPVGECSFQWEIMGGSSVMRLTWKRGGSIGAGSKAAKIGDLAFGRFRSPPAGSIYRVIRNIEF
jgi:hypothetical protein